jgi:hypothetical protein
MAVKPHDTLFLQQLANQQPMNIDYRTMGRTGLRSSGGQIFEETLPQLQGKRGYDVYRDMLLNDATCGTVINLIDKVIRGVGWRADRASDHPNDRAAADFLEECLHDLTSSFTDQVSEIMTMLPYGFSLFEICLKRRAGDADDPSMASRYKDGRIGWRAFPIRSQDTIQRWLTNSIGDIVAVEQCAPPDYKLVTIPMDKLLLFRTSSHKNSPEGLSIFRSAYRSFYKKRALENTEAISAERDLAGLPMALVPPEVLAGQTDEDRAMLAAIQDIVTNVRNDEQAGLIFPMAYDDGGRPLFDFKLLSSPGSKQIDTDKIISRYDSRIAMCALADFILLGQNASAQGSWAMHSDKTKIFAQSLGAYLDIISGVFNRFAIPRLMRLNTFKVDEYPRLEHDNVERVDLDEVGKFLQAITASGAAIFPNESIEKRLVEMAGLPPLVTSEEQGPMISPLGNPNPEKVQEIHEGDTPEQTTALGDVSGIKGPT